jgi:hypothetical protein
MPVFEESVPSKILFRVEDLHDLGKVKEAVFRANRRSQYVVQRMLDGLTGCKYRPRLFSQTDTFRAIALSSLGESSYKISSLVTEEQARQLEKEGITTVGDLMSANIQKSVFGFLAGGTYNLVQDLRSQIRESTNTLVDRIIEYQEELYAAGSDARHVDVNNPAA